VDRLPPAGFEVYHSEKSVSAPNCPKPSLLVILSRIALLTCLLLALKNDMLVIIPFPMRWQVMVHNPLARVEDDALTQREGLFNH